MAESADRAPGGSFWSGVNVAYGSSVAAILLIAGGLFLYNHGFTSGERLRQEESALALSPDLYFAPLPDEARAVRVWNPFRDLELACQTARWSDGDEHLVVAWCPTAMLDQPYRQDDIHDSLFGLIGLDVEEPDGHARTSTTFLSSAGRYMPARSFAWLHTALRCFDAASIDVRPIGDAAVGALGIAQVCLRGSEEMVRERRDALLDALAARAADGQVIWPWRTEVAS